MRVRPMIPADAGQVAELSTQLGYPSSPDQIAQRFAVVAERPDHGVFVAVAPAGPVFGVIHVRVADLLELDPIAVIESLVVDERSRGRGIGGYLVRQRSSGRARAESARCGSARTLRARRRTGSTSGSGIRAPRRRSRSRSRYRVVSPEC